MGRRFTALRVIGTIFKVLAWIFLLLGLFAAILILIVGLTSSNQLKDIGLDMGGVLPAVAAFVVILVVSIFQFLFLYGFGELFFLFLSVEENSRRTAYFSQQMFAAGQTNYPVPATPPDYED